MTILLCDSLRCRQNVDGVCILDVAKINLNNNVTMNNFDCFKFESKPPNQCMNCGKIVKTFREGHHSFMFKCERCGREFSVAEEDMGICDGL